MVKYKVIMLLKLNSLRISSLFVWIPVNWEQFQVFQWKTKYTTHLCEKVIIPWT